MKINQMISAFQSLFDRFSILFRRIDWFLVASVLATLGISLLILSNSFDLSVDGILVFIGLAASSAFTPKISKYVGRVYKIPGLALLLVLVVWLVSIFISIQPSLIQLTWSDSLGFISLPAISIILIGLGCVIFGFGIYHYLRRANSKILIIGNLFFLVLGSLYSLGWIVFFGCLAVVIAIFCFWARENYEVNPGEVWHKLLLATLFFSSIYSSTSRISQVFIGSSFFVFEDMPSIISKAFLFLFWFLYVKAKGNFFRLKVPSFWRAFIMLGVILSLSFLFPDPLYFCLAFFSIIIFESPSSYPGYVKASLAGFSVSFFLISILITPSQNLAYLYFVPGLPQSFSFEEFFLAFGVVLVILFEMAPLVVFWAKPQHRLQAIWLVTLSGLIVGMFIFAYIGAPVASLAAQRSLYGAAYSPQEMQHIVETTPFQPVGTVGRIYTIEDYRNIVVPLSEAVLYSFPLTLAAFGLSILIGVVPAALTTLFLPIRTKPSTTTEPKQAISYILLLILVNVFLNIVVSIAALRIMDDLIAKIAIQTGIQYWWKPEWIVIASISFMLIATPILAVWGIYHAQKTQSSALLSVFLGLSGLSFALFALVIFFIEGKFYSISLISLGFAIEYLILAKQKWAHPLSGDDYYVEFKRNWPGDAFQAGIVGSAFSAPLLAISLGLVLITVVAITPLQSITAPLGKEWLSELVSGYLVTSNALMFHAVFVFPVLGNLAIAFIFQNLIGWIADPVWFGKISRIFSWYRSFSNRILGKWQKYIKFVYAVLLVLVIRSVIPSWILFAALATYLYVVLEPKRFSLLGNRSNILASVFAVTGLVIFLFQDHSTLRTIADLLLGMAVALFLRSILVYTPGRFRLVTLLFFFVSLSGIVAIINQYRVPAQKLDSGIAVYKELNWVVFNEKNSPLHPEKIYSLQEGINGDVLLSSYTGLDFAYQNGAWRDIYLWSEILSNETAGEILSNQDSADNMQLAPGKIFLERENLWYRGVNRISLIQDQDAQYALKNLGRPGELDTGQDSSLDVDPNEFVVDESCPVGTGVSSICPAFGTITDVSGDGAGGFWVGTAEKGVWHLTVDEVLDAEWQAFTTKNSRLLSNQIKRVLRGSDGNVWAISDLGISILSSDTVVQDFTLDEIGLSGIPQSGLADHLGRVWVGSSESIVMWNGSMWAALAPENETMIYDFFEDSRGTIWALTSSGLLKNEGLTWNEPIDIHQDPLWENPFGIQIFYILEPYEAGVRVMAEDSRGNLWVGGPRGLLQLNPLTGEQVLFYPSNSGLPSENVRDIFVAQDGAIWVSTYTVNTAHLSALPVFGLSFFLIALIALLINAGYQNSPQRMASRIYREILNRPDDILPKLYGFVSQNTAYSEIQEYLEEYLSGSQYLSDLVRVYRIPKSEDEVLSHLTGVIETLEKQQTQDAHSLAFLYRGLLSAFQIHSILEIAQWDFRVTAFQEGQQSLMTFAGLPPVECPVWVNAQVWDVLKAMNRGAEYLKKYLQVDNAQDKLAYIADSLHTLDLARNSARFVSHPERNILIAILDVWHKKVSYEISLMSGQADLRVEFRTRQIRRSAQMVILLNIKNIGRAIAESIRISNMPDDSYQILPESRFTIEQLSAGDSVNIEWFVHVPTSREIRVAGIIEWSDRSHNKNSVQFADVIRFFEAAERFEPITPNPFEVGKPIKTASLFYGRDDIFEFISQNLASSTQSRTLVLHGQRRTGKTSILYQVLGGRLGTGFVPVLVDMQELALSINSTADLFIEFTEKICRAAQRSGIEVARPDETAFERSPARAFNRFLDELEERLNGKKMLLMIDEFEILEEKINQKKLEADVLSYVRSMIQHRDYLAFLFTGTHKLEQMSKDYWSIFFNIAIHKQVSFMEKVDAEKLIRVPVQGRLGIDDLTVEKILMLTSGHPYFIQLLCYKLVELCNRQERNYATVNDLNLVVNDLVVDGENHFAYFWKMASIEQQLVLSAIAEILGPGKNTASITEILELIISAGVSYLEKTDLIQILDNLAEQDILLLHTGGAMQYSYKVGLIAEWVKKAKTLRILVERNL